MPGKVPDRPKIFHIVHVDRLHSIFEEGYLLSDSEVRRRGISGTTIGDLSIKERRLSKRLHSYPGTNVGDYVPFYFCPRSVLLYKNWRTVSGNNLGSSEPANQSGEDEIVHLEADLKNVVRHADANKVGWVFTDMNAASAMSRDFDCLSQLTEIDWNIIESRRWQGDTDVKMAEFLTYKRFPVHLIDRIGVKLESIQSRVARIVAAAGCDVRIKVMRTWYYGT